MTMRWAPARIQHTGTDWCLHRRSGPEVLLTGGGQIGDQGEDLGADRD
jgi:hypothetical protein